MGATVRALTWRNPDGAVHWAVETSDPARIDWEHHFRQRTWPHTNPRLVDVEIIETRWKLGAVLLRAAVWVIPPSWLLWFLERCGVHLGSSH